MSSEWELYVAAKLLTAFKHLFYLGFLSLTFKIPRAAGKGSGYLFNSPLAAPLASQTLRY